MATVSPDHPDDTSGGRRWLAVPAIFVLVALAGLISVLTLPYRQGGIAGDGAPPAPTPNVVILVIDTLRADRLGLYGYPEPTSPNLDALGKESVVFTSCYAPAPWTLPSVVSLMTSTFPCEHGVIIDGQRIDPALQSLPELLSPLGYATGSFYANPYAGPLPGLDRGYDHCAFHQATDGAIVQAWLSTIGHAPFFAYIHNIEPHDPYVAPDRLVSLFGRVSEADKKEIGERLLGYRRLTRIDYANGQPIGTTDNTADQEASIAGIAQFSDDIDVLYAGAVRDADEKVGSIIATLRETGAWEHTLFIVLSDHGEELYDHGGWQHDQSVYEELVHVPLIVHFPAAAARSGRVDHVVSLVDVVPTILDFLGHGAPPHHRGRSLMPIMPSTDAPGSSHPASASDAMCVPSVRINRKKYFKPYVDSRGHVNIVVRESTLKGIYNVEPKTLELYDLSVDPGEQRDLATDRPDAAARLTAFAAEWLRDCVRLGAARGGPKDPEELDETVRARLRSLGYVE